MKIFWSWQSDLDSSTHRNFIKDCLVEAINKAGQDLEAEDAERVELDHDTKDAAGMVDIADTILKKS